MIYSRGRDDVHSHQVQRARTRSGATIVDLQSPDCAEDRAAAGLTYTWAGEFDALRKGAGAAGVISQSGLRDPKFLAAVSPIPALGRA